jgi:hypothetical protein
MCVFNLFEDVIDQKAIDNLSIAELELLSKILEKVK